MPKQTIPIDRQSLEKLYDQFNHREFVSPDPLEVVLRYDDTADREIAALIASSLAYGRVAQIVKSVSTVLDRVKSPSGFLRRCTNESLRRRFAGFRHRFTAGRELSSMLFGIKRVISDYGSLERCYISGMNGDDPDSTDALGRFASRIREASDSRCNTLLPCPDKGSACKRLNLFLKWMVRRDRVDPGGWDAVDKSVLLMPLDTHIHRIGRLFGMTGRKQADLKTAREITAGFRRIAPEDPTKYDFALTRLGMKYSTGIVDYFRDSSSEEITKNV